MDINVSSFKSTVLVKRFSQREKLVLLLFLFVPFTCYIANYSAYYVPNLNVYSSTLAVLALITFGQSLIDPKTKQYAIIYVFVVSIVWLSPLFFHFQSPSVKLLYELSFAGCFISIRNEGKLWVYDKFIKILALVLAFGIVEYLLVRIGIIHILGEAIRPNSTNVNVYYQGIFNIFPFYYSSGIFRFQSIAEEPGLVGTLCFFILATINLKKYKIQSLIFWIAGIISMSLAFYVLFFLWAIFSISIRKIKYVLLGLIVVGVTYYYFQDLANELILTRVLEDSKEGSIDNRNSEAVSQLYDNTFSSFETFFCGIGNRTFEEMDTGNSAGIKKYIVQYGFIMIMMVVIAFCSLFLKYHHKNKRTLVILFVFLVSLYQRFDLNLSTNIIVLFSAFLIKNEENNKAII